MATSLGIHLRADGFHYVLLEGSAKKHVVKASGEGRFPSALAPAKALGKLLAEAVRVRKADHLTLALPSPRVVLRELSLPFQDREKVLQVLKFEVESELYHLAVDDVVADFLPLEGERATPALLVGVMPKTHLKQALAVADAAGWDPSAVTASFGGFASAASSFAPELADAESAAEGASAPPLAFVHVGADETLLALTGPTGRLRAARSLPVGWLEVLRDLAAAQAAATKATESSPASAAAPAAASEATESTPSEASPSDSQSAKRGTKEEEPEAEPASALFGADPALPTSIGLEEALGLAGHGRVEALCKRLANEIRRGLAAMPAGAAAIHLSGASLPGLDEALGARAGLPVQRLRRGASAAGEDLIAFGAALEGFGAAPAAMNFRQEEYRYARGLERVEGPLTLALVGLIAWLVIDSGVHLKQAMHLKGECERVYLAADARVTDLNKRVTDDEDYPDVWLIRNDLSGLEVSDRERIAQLDARVRGASKQLDELMGQSDLEMPPSCLEGWRLLMEYLEKELGAFPDKWMIESFDFTSVDGRGNSEAHVEAKFGLTLKSDDAERVAATFDRLDRGLREQPWCLGAPSIPSTESAEVPPGKYAQITVKIRTARAAEPAAKEDAQ